MAAPLSQSGACHSWMMHIQTEPIVMPLSAIVIISYYNNMLPDAASPPSGCYTLTLLSTVYCSLRYCSYLIIINYIYI